MQIRKAQVLKREDCRLEGTVTLPVGSVPPVLSAGQAAGRACGPAQARIVESNSDYAILEIFCGCGQKSFVQCNYGNVAVGG